MAHRSVDGRAADRRPARAPALVPAGIGRRASDVPAPRGGLRATARARPRPRRRSGSRGSGPPRSSRSRGRDRRGSGRRGALGRAAEADPEAVGPLHRSGRGVATTGRIGRGPPVASTGGSMPTGSVHQEVPRNSGDPAERAVSSSDSPEPCWRTRRVRADASPSVSPGSPRPRGGTGSRRPGGRPESARPLRWRPRAGPGSAPGGRRHGGRRPCGRPGAPPRRLLGVDPPFDSTAERVATRAGRWSSSAVSAATVSSADVTTETSTSAAPSISPRGPPDSVVSTPVGDGSAATTRDRPPLVRTCRCIRSQALFAWETTTSFAVPVGDREGLDFVSTLLTSDPPPTGPGATGPRQVGEGPATISANTGGQRPPATSSTVEGAAPESAPACDPVAVAAQPPMRRSPRRRPGRAVPDRPAPQQGTRTLPPHRVPV